MRRHELLLQLEARPELAAAWEPAPAWLVAAAPLPGGREDGDEVRSLGFAFAEGRDRLVGQGKSGNHALRRLREIVARKPNDLATCEGDFGFLFFGASDAITVVRSCGGLVPLYYAVDGERLAVGTRLEYLVRFFGRDLPLDPLVNAISAGHGWLPADGRTFFAGVSALPRGHFVRLAPGVRARAQRYWDPRAKRESDLIRGPERPQVLRELLVANLKRELDPGGDNLLSLSGGVDSSTLAALAIRVVGCPVSALSFVPPELEQQATQLHFINALAAEVELKRRWTIPLSPAKQIELLLSDHSVLYHVQHPVLLTLPRILDETSVKVLFGGEFGDEVSGSRVTLPDWTAHTSLRQLLTGLDSLPYGEADLLRWTKHRLLRLVHRPRMFCASELSEIIRPELRAEYRELYERRRQELGRDRRPLGHLAVTSEDETWLAQNWEAASSHGVRRSFPFATRELVEFAFRSHPRDLLGPGTKKLLRNAVRGDVPAKNLGRMDKGGWRGPSRHAACLWETPLAAELEEIVRSDWHPAPPRAIRWGEAAELAQLSKFADNLANARGGVARASYSIGGSEQWNVRVTR